MWRARHVLVLNRNAEVEIIDVPNSQKIMFNANSNKYLDTQITRRNVAMTNQQGIRT